VFQRDEISLTFELVLIHQLNLKKITGGGGGGRGLLTGRTLAVI
jgi:hypothetical protein